MRTFLLTLTNTNWRNLQTLASAVTGAAPTGGYLFNKFISLVIQASSGNAGTITIGDYNTANTEGPVLSAGMSLSMLGPSNLSDFNLKASNANDTVRVMVSYVNGGND